MSLDTTAVANMLSSDGRSIQANILDEFEKQILGEDELVDPNNVPSFMIEMISRLTSSAVTRIDDGLNALYPARAQSFPDLYRHMSTFHYPGLFSSPAPTSLVLYLDRRYLINQAEIDPDAPDGAHTKKAVIPEGTVFNLGDYRFRLHYPIIIRIFEGESLVVMWDTSVENPLYSLSTSVIEHRSITGAGTKLVSINIPVEQFDIVEHVESVNSANGLVKNYEYTDKFYTTRIFHTPSGGTAEELAVTMSERIYDVNRPTAILTVDPKYKTCRIAIPPIYFNRDMIGPELTIRIYTTQGEIDIDVSESDINDITMEIPSGNELTRVISRMPLKRVTPMSPRITGGSNGLTFSELRDRVVFNSFYDGAPITRTELTNYFSDAGFNVLRWRDDLTNRVYHAMRSLTDDRGAFGAGWVRTILPIGDSVLSTDLDVFPPVTRNQVTDNGDGTHTICPDLIYDINPTTGRAKPLRSLADLRGELATNMVPKVNANSYVFSPFHLKISSMDRYPMGYSYQLNNPSIQQIEFKEENKNQDYRVSVQNATLTAALRGFDDSVVDHAIKYTLQLDLFFSENLSDKTETIEDVTVIVGFRSAKGGLYATAKTFDLGVENPETSIVLDITSEANLPGYDSLGISIPGAVKTTGVEEWKPIGDPVNVDVNLDCEIEVYALRHDDSENDSFEGLEQAMSSVDGMLMSRNLLSSLNRQTVTVRFGERLEDVHNPVSLEYTSKEYSSLTEPVYSTYISDVYKRTEGGLLTMNVDSDATAWNMPVNPVYDLTVTHAEYGTPGRTRMSVATNTGSVPEDIEVGMAVDLSDYGNFPTYVTAVEDIEGVIYIVVNRILNSAAGIQVTLGDSFLATAISDPLTGLVNLTVIHRQGDWVFPEDEPFVDGVTIGIDGTITLSVEAYNYVIDTLNWPWTDDNEHRLCLTSDSIAPGAWVSDINAEREITLNDPGLLTVPGTTTVEDLRIGIPYTRGGIGDPDFDSALSDRSIKYTVGAIMLDAGSLLLTRRSPSGVLVSMTRTMEGYFSSVASVRSTLMPGTDVFYIPTRTVGLTVNEAGGAGGARTPVAFELSMRLHVPHTVIGDDDAMTNIRKSIVRITDEHTLNGRFVFSALCSQIMRDIPEVKYVDPKGVKSPSGEWDGHHTFIPSDDTVRPILRRILTINDNKIVVEERSLDLEFVQVD